MDIKSKFEEEGYVSPLDALSANEVLHYRECFDELEAEVGKDKAQISLSYKEFEYPWIWELATHEKILDRVQEVYGEDIVFIATHFFCKYPEKEKTHYVAWHQDATYWGIKPSETITVWLALDDVDVENGCMQVIPHSHKLGILEHGKGDEESNLLSINQAIDEDLFSPDTAVNLCMKAGQLSLHEGRTIHGSQSNLSDRRRCGLTIRYIRPNVVLEGENERWNPVLLRGEDRYGHLDYVR
ncbi:MAG: phytanoyl-CoA dioxygenase family protein [Lentisphaeria bacterium]|nr:phytanoyl-CoA dioxygenase family protein [Lentisphaeria bacterium]